jgi:SAM-dependent methyltransferase
VTLSGPSAAERFSATADAYAATMAPALFPVAQEVVRRARLRPGERVLDVGTGTGNAARIATDAGARVIGLDTAAGMLEVARREHPAIEFVEGDMASLPFADGAFDAVVSCHVLLFAEDHHAALTEWRRVVRDGGRLSMSVPGPWEEVVGRIYADVYDRYDLALPIDYPTESDLAAWASAAGWRGVETAADPDNVIPLADDAAFDRWLSIGARGAAIRDWMPERKRALRDDLIAITPRAADGSFRIPFGALFLTASASA